MTPFMTLICRINGAHNKAVVSEILAAIGTDSFEEADIQSKRHVVVDLYVTTVLDVGGCKTYKKTIAERPKHDSTPIKAKKQMRSRKQRVSLFSKSLPGLSM